VTTGRDLLALVADRLEFTPWPPEVIAAVELVVDDVYHSAECTMCHSGLAVGEIDRMLAAFTSGDTGPGMDELAAACTDLARELRQGEPRCAARRS